PAEREVRLAVLVPPPPAAPAPVAASIQGEGIRGLIDFVSSIGKQGLQLNSLCLSENAVKAFTRVGLGDGATLCTFILNMLNQETGGGKKAASDILSAILKMNAILEDNPESDLLTPQLQDVTRAAVAKDLLGITLESQPKAAGKKPADAKRA